MNVNKAALRAHMKTLRLALGPQEWQSKCALICDHLLAHPKLRGANSVALFDPLLSRHEVDIGPVAAALAARDVELYYPAFTLTHGSDIAGEFRQIRTPSDFRVGAFSVRQPAEHCRVAQRGDIDVMLVPCMAVSPAGFRLGYGSGFYDRLLPTLCPPAESLAVAFAFQVVPHVPTEVNDVPVSEIVTEEGVLPVA
jgi:5-formyltetrahydrofolate cyclo-ligase